MSATLRSATLGTLRPAGARLAAEESVLTGAGRRATGSRTTGSRGTGAAGRILP